MTLFANERRFAIIIVVIINIIFVVASDSTITKQQLARNNSRAASGSSILAIFPTDRGACGHARASDFLCADDGRRSWLEWQKRRSATRPTPETRAAHRRRGAQTPLPEATSAPTHLDAAPIASCSGHAPACGDADFLPCRRMRGHACHPVPSLRATLLPCTPATPRISGSPHPLYSLRTRHRRRRRVVQSLMHAERRRATETALRWLDEAGESSRGGVAAVSRMSQDHNPQYELKGTSPTPTRKGFLLASDG